MNTTVSSSFTPDTTKILPKIDKMRKEEFKKYKKEIEEGNVVKAVEISDKLVAAAKAELKDDVGMILYDSKAKPKFGNNYKNMFLVRSPVYLTDRGEFQAPTTAFLDGVGKDKNSITQMGTSVVNGAYSKCCRTAEAG